MICGGYDLGLDSWAQEAGQQMGDSVLQSLGMPIKTDVVVEWKEAATLVNGIETSTFQMTVFSGTGPTREAAETDAELKARIFIGLNDALGMHQYTNSRWAKCAEEARGVRGWPKT